MCFCRYFFFEVGKLFLFYQEKFFFKCFTNSRAKQQTGHENHEDTLQKTKANFKLHFQTKRQKKRRRLVRSGGGGASVHCEERQDLTGPGPGLSMR